MLQLPFGRHWNLGLAYAETHGLRANAMKVDAVRVPGCFHRHFRQARRKGDRSDAGVGVDLCVHRLGQGDPQLLGCLTDQNPLKFAFRYTGKAPTAPLVPVYWSQDHGAVQARAFLH